MARAPASSSPRRAGAPPPMGRKAEPRGASSAGWERAEPCGGQRRAEPPRGESPAAFPSAGMGGASRPSPSPLFITWPAHHERLLLERVCEPVLADALGGVLLLEGLAQDGEPAEKLAFEDRVGAVGGLERPARVLDGSAQVLRGKLELFFLDALATRALEHEPDHRVLEQAFDEALDDAAERRLPTELLEQRGAGVAHPSCRK